VYSTAINVGAGMAVCSQLKYGTFGSAFWTKRC